MASNCTGSIVGGKGEGVTERIARRLGKILGRTDDDKDKVRNSF